MRLHLAPAADCGVGALARTLCSARLGLSVLAAALFAVGSSATRCFCDKRNCADALMCDGEWCMVGFKSDVRLDQLCATGAEAEVLRDCKQSWQGWVEVCACRDDFCNTFNYLRTQMERMRGAPPLGSDAYQSGGGTGGSGVHASHVRDPGAATLPIYQGNQLIILLVVVPLAVGAAAVCLVFLNYHCKMC